MVGFMRVPAQAAQVAKVAKVATRSTTLRTWGCSDSRSFGFLSLSKYPSPTPR